MGATSSVQDADQGKYLDPNHNRPDGLFRWLTKEWIGVHHHKPAKHAYTLRGYYRKSELVLGAMMGSHQINAGDMWEVPITTDGHAIFNGYKWAPDKTILENYQVKKVQVGQNTTLEFYPLFGLNRGQKVNTWQMVPSVNDSHIGRYRNANGRYRFLTKGRSEGIRRITDEVKYTLSGIYNEHELEGGSNWVGPPADPTSIPLSQGTGSPPDRFHGAQVLHAGDQWKVPVYEDDIAEFAGNKAAQEGHIHENCRIEPVQDEAWWEGTKLNFYSTDEATYNELVDRWTRVPDSTVIDLATAKSAWLGQHGFANVVQAHNLQQRLKRHRANLEMPITECGWQRDGCNVIKRIFFVQVGRKVVDDDGDEGPGKPSYQLCIDGTGEPLADGLTRVYVVASIWRSKKLGDPQTWLNISLDVIDTHRAEDFYGLEDIATEFVAPDGDEPSLKIAAYDLAKAIVGLDEQVTGLDTGRFLGRMAPSTIVGNKQAEWWLTEPGQQLNKNLFTVSEDALFEKCGERLVNINVSFAEPGRGNDFKPEDEIQNWNGGGFWYTTDATIKRGVRDRLKRDSNPPGSVSLLGRGALYHWVLQYMAGVHRGESGPHLALQDAWSGYLKNDDKAKLAIKKKVNEWARNPGCEQFRRDLLRLLVEIQEGALGEVPQYTKSMYCKRRVWSEDIQDAYDEINPKSLVGLSRYDLIDKVLFPLRVQVYVEQMTDHIERYGIQTSDLPDYRERFRHGIYDGYQEAYSRQGRRYLTQPDTVEASFAPAPTAGAEMGRAQ